MNKTLGYETPADVVYKYPQFYWNNVAPQVQAAIRYLNVTSSGRQWIANLHSNVFRAEREMKPVRPAAIAARAVISTRRFCDTGDTQAFDEPVDETRIIAEEELLPRLSQCL